MTSREAPRILALVAGHQLRNEDPWLLVASLYARLADAKPDPGGCRWVDWPRDENGWVSERVCGEPVAVVHHGYEPPAGRLLRDRADRHQLQLCEDHIEELSDRIEHGAEAVRRKDEGSRRGSGRGKVYYIRRALDGQIKIGVSVDPKKRMDSMRTAVDGLELLVTEPGGYEREAERHAQWAKHRTRGEWFEPTPDLLNHIDSLKRMPDVPAPQPKPRRQRRKASAMYRDCERCRYSKTPCNLCSIQAAHQRAVETAEALTLQLDERLAFLAHSVPEE